ncbi:hypothetical protein QBC45DRAFT_339185 [Copromyces sp. CBS 386.78]|nr:hypothetical protein QBC45DRAFT_339185 [Copromyces sp. CBS 386.78]
MRAKTLRTFVDACSPRNLTHYDPEDEPTSCLSTEPHDTTVDDAVQHYFGCIEICDRAKFLKPDHPHWIHERGIQYEKCHTELTKTMDKFLATKDNDKWENHLKTAQEKLRKAGHAVPDGGPLTIDSVSDAKANKWLEKRMGSVAIAIEAQYKRIEVLRTALGKTPTPQSRIFLDQQPAAKKEEFVVTQLEESRAKWKGSPRFKRGIEWVRQWRKETKGANEDDNGIESDEPGRKEVKDLARKQRTKKNTENGHQPNHDLSNGIAEDAEKDCTEYHLERDVNAYLIQFSTEHDTDKPSQDPETFLTPIDEPLTDGRFKGTFPDQRISMSFLLYNGATPHEPESTDNPRLRHPDPQGDWNILSRNRCKSQGGSEPPKRIRYFHIPSNNMAWVEKAVANYYETETPDLNRKLRHQRVQTPTHMLLSPQYWRGQQQGTRSGVVHARHMRSLCEVVSTETSEIEKHPKNIVLFMPYLHWETDRRREAISRLIDIESDKSRRNHKEEKLKKKTVRQEKRQRLFELSKDDIEKRKIKHPKEGAEDLESRNKLVENVDLALYQLFRRRREPRRGERPYIDDSGRLIVMSALGQYLVDAARLYEAMSTFRDQRMLEKYLFHDPPLHPRRTLDQSYYWTLRTTKARDRDQVIYRDTKLDFIHKLQEADKPKHSWIKRQSSPREPLNRTTNSTTSVTGEEPAHGPGDHGIAQNVEDDVSPLMKWTQHSETTDEHGCDQCKSDIKKVSQLIMVDQLWMWVLDEHTIITSFPRRYGSNKHDLSGVHRSIRARLKSFRKNQVRSVYDLALIILDECSNTFFDRTRADEGQPQVMDIFSEAIGRVTNQHTISFQHVWHWTQEASKIYRARSKYVSSADLHVSLLDINPEGKLQREVKDILDELDIMLHVHKRQRDIMKRFRRHVEHILDPKNRWSGDCFIEEDTSEPSRKSSGNASVRGGSNGKSEEKTGIDEEETRRREQLGWFRVQYQELLSEVNDRIDELEGLRAGAKSTADSVNDLLALKQQQSSVVQAWESVRQAEEAVTQGRAVMMFTIVTIVFLPLSFMSSIFGMNNFEFTESGPMHLGEQFKLMFSISIGIIIATIVVAFSPLLRATVVSFTKYVFTVIVVYSQLYRFWVVFHDEYRSQSLMYKTELKVRKMKEEVRKAKRKRAARRAELLNKRNNPDEDGQASETANAASEMPKRGWLGRLFGAGSPPIVEGKPTRRSELIPNGKPESREAVENGEQSYTRPPSTVSNVTTQVNTNTMFGGNTPIRSANTPEPGLSRIGSDPGEMV